MTLATRCPAPRSVSVIQRASEARRNEVRFRPAGGFTCQCEVLVSGRTSTWRLPRFSAFEMDLRQSARTCGDKGEGSVLVAALLMCVAHGERCGAGAACEPTAAP